MSKSFLVITTFRLFYLVSHFPPMLSRRQNFHFNPPSPKAMTGNKELIGAAKLHFTGEFFTRNFRKERESQQIDFHIYTAKYQIGRPIV